MPGGRPRKEIDKIQFENLCKMQCTEEEICGWFDVTDKTLNSWCKREYRKNFSEVFKAKRQGGKISLRRNQWKLSETNANMAIWLGKQYLGQCENMQAAVDISVGEDDPITKALNDELERIEAERIEAEKKEKEQLHEEEVTDADQL